MPSRFNFFPSEEGAPFGPANTRGPNIPDTPSPAPSYYGGDIIPSVGDTVKMNNGSCWSNSGPCTGEIVSLIESGPNAGSLVIKQSDGSRGGGGVNGYWLAVPQQSKVIRSASSVIRKVFSKMKEINRFSGKLKVDGGRDPLLDYALFTWAADSSSSLGVTGTDEAVTVTNQRFGSSLSAEMLQRIEQYADSSMFPPRTSANQRIEPTVVDIENQESQILQTYGDVDTL